jgi:hypothetical protein
MSNNVVPHLHRDLMAEADRERKAAESQEGRALQVAICKAINAYSKFLECRGVIWDDSFDFPRMRLKR